MKIIVIGLRGIPDVLGGVETHCENLYPIIASENNTEVTLICRSPYVNKNRTEYKGVLLKTLYAPKSKTFEAIIHTYLAVLYAAFKRPDIVHIHAIGPNLMTPFARLLGLKVIMTHHGPDYKRKKWSRAGKLFLKVGEWAGVKFANRVIVISKEIQELITQKYNRKDSILIPNGVEQPIIDESKDFLKQHNLQPNKYIFALGRFVPEKGFDYLIKAFKKANLGEDIKLVLAGDADHETSHSKYLKDLAVKENVILTGYVSGLPLAQLFYNAGLFVISSFYEGLPIALLEAVAYKLPILASNIKANEEVGLPKCNYFSVGDEHQLCTKLQHYHKANIIGTRVNYDMEKYDWKTISRQTLHAYHNVIQK